MIQRIQTVWLLLASLVIFALFLFPYLQYSDLTGQAAALRVNGVYGVLEGKVVQLETNWLQLMMTFLVGIMPLYIIFEFKNRKKQKALIFLSMTLVVLFELWLYFASTSAMALADRELGLPNLGVGFFLLPIAFIFLFLAWSAIRKDEKLIRSVDRLR